MNDDVDGATASGDSVTKRKCRYSGVGEIRPRRAGRIDKPSRSVASQRAGRRTSAIAYETATLAITVLPMPVLAAGPNAIERRSEGSLPLPLTFRPSNLSRSTSFRTVSYRTVRGHVAEFLPPVLRTTGEPDRGGPDQRAVRPKPDGPNPGAAGV